MSDKRAMESVDQEESTPVTSSVIAPGGLRLTDSSKDIRDSFTENAEQFDGLMMDMLTESDSVKQQLKQSQADNDKLRGALLEIQTCEDDEYSGIAEDALEGEPNEH